VRWARPKWTGPLDAWTMRSTRARPPRGTQQGLETQRAFGIIGSTSRFVRRNLNCIGGLFSGGEDGVVMNPNNKPGQQHQGGGQPGHGGQQGGGGQKPGQPSQQPGQGGQQGGGGQKPGQQGGQPNR